MSWGKLISLNSKYNHVDLIKNEITLGRKEYVFNF